jgi:hypothetical protein
MQRHDDFDRILFPETLTELLGSGHLVAEQDAYEASQVDVPLPMASLALVENALVRGPVDEVESAALVVSAAVRQPRCD